MINPISYQNVLSVYIIQSIIWSILKCLFILYVFLNFWISSAVCGGEIVKEHGMLSSPNYPEFYKPSKDCTWKITVPEGYTAALKFQSFEVRDKNNDLNIVQPIKNIILYLSKHIVPQ